MPRESREREGGIRRMIYDAISPLQKTAKPKRREQHIAAYCAKCGSIQWVVDRNITEQVKVPPCRYCIEGAREDGYQAGYDDGFAYGQDAKEKS